jgi:hypothetical protein
MAITNAQIIINLNGPKISKHQLIKKNKTARRIRISTIFSNLFGT